MSPPAEGAAGPRLVGHPRTCVSRKGLHNFLSPSTSGRTGRLPNGAVTFVTSIHSGFGQLAFTTAGLPLQPSRLLPRRTACHGRSIGKVSLGLEHPASGITWTRTLADVTRRVGIFGGTFDPPHIGHLAVAVYAKDHLGLDEVVLVVANDPWQKSAARIITAATHRLKMVELSVAEHPGLTTSDVEIQRGGESFTVDTVNELMSGQDAELFLVLGSDAAAGLSTWHRAADLAQLVEVAVVQRPGESAAVPPGWMASPVPMPLLDISSSHLRDRIAAGRSVDVLVPGPVVTYIERHALYSR